MLSLVFCIVTRYFGANFTAHCRKKFDNFFLERALAGFEFFFCFRKLLHTVSIFKNKFKFCVRKGFGVVSERVLGWFLSKFDLCITV